MPWRPRTHKPCARSQAKIAAKKEELKKYEANKGEEKKRVRALFDRFDTNNDGILDAKEFRLLAYEAGIDVSQLTKEKVREIRRVGQRTRSSMSGCHIYTHAIARVAGSHTGGRILRGAFQW